LTYAISCVNITSMNTPSSGKKTQLENFRLFYESIPVPEIDPNRNLLDNDKPNSRTPRNKRVSRPRR